MAGVLVVVGSVKGAPGASCLTAGLAVWLRQERGRPVLVVDADPAGGVFAVRADLAAGRGLGSLAATTRGAPLSPATVTGHAAALPCGAGVLPGSVGAAEARSALQVLDGPLAGFATARPDREVVLVDAGRLPTAMAVARQLLAAADGMILVAAADREGLGQAAAWLQAIGELAERVAIVARQPAAGGYSGREIADALGVAVLAGLPADPRAARSAFTATEPLLRGRAGRWWRPVGEVGDHILRLAPASATSSEGSDRAAEVRR
jgi:MinD-like ATPase involved in chromosome partitioning or flagellar assembly